MSLKTARRRSRFLGRKGITTWCALFLVSGLGVMIGGISIRAQGRATNPPVVFDGVTVIDVVQGKLVPGQRVVIVGNRIRNVGGARKVKIPKGAQVVDARGKYLIPGLWDMHAHAVGARKVYSLLVANGITGIREMGSDWPDDFAVIRQQRREIASGTLVGPRIVATSNDFYSPVCKREILGRIAQKINTGSVNTVNPPDSSQLASWIKNMVDSSGCFVMNGKTVRTPEDVRRMVNTLKAGGVDFVKAHMISDREVYFAFLAEARRVGIPAVGHLGGYDGQALTEIEASDSGLRSVEHIGEMSCWQDKRRVDKVVPWDSIAEKQCALVAARFKRNGTWLVPTLYVYNNPVFINVSDSTIHTHAVTIMHRAGVPMLAGTDAATKFNEPEQNLESALHKELALLVKTGFTPLEALQAATWNVAKFFKATDSLGTIAPGKVADCVLLDANPLVDIHNSRTIRAVVANGHYFDRAALDVLIQKNREGITGPWR